MLRRQDVGHRVVVRRRIAGGSPDRPLFTDALGELVSLTETDLTIATDRGTLRVPLHEVHRAKRVPAARRPPAADVVALELAANDAWPAPIQGRVGRWILRAAGNWTGRANSALAVGDPDRTLDEAIDAVERWYAEHGQQPLITAPLPLAAPVNAALDERGWTARPLTLVQTAPLASLLTVGGERAGLPPVDLAGTPSPDWLALLAGYKGGPPPAAAGILTGPAEVVFADVRDGDGTLIAAARGAVTGPDRWLGISLLQTVPAARRRGLGRHMLRALARWGGQHGSSRAYLQVEERNTAAVGLYADAGFATHHTYLTRQAPV